MKARVAVLMGGWSTERAVSLVSGAAVSSALESAGYAVTAIDVQRDVSGLLSSLTPRPDVVFNALHGRYGEDGCIQGLLNILEIPYTHSGVLASALAMNKPMAKRLFAQAGIPVVEHQVVSREALEAGEVMAPPYVIKPSSEGSSVGIRIVREGDALESVLGTDWSCDGEIMVEKYIPGQELTVAVMGERALAVTEITTARGFYDYDAKYAPGGSHHVIPAGISDSLYAECLRLAVVAHQALGCRGVSRADFRYDGTAPYILEVNTQPGMTPTSLVPEQAAHVGISFPDLVSWMVENATCDS